jgi:hypothetical protein
MLRSIALGMMITLAMALTAPVAIAQQKHHVSYDTPATQTVYTQQHVIKLGSSKFGGPMVTMPPLSTDRG